MATKDSNISTMNKNKETIKKVSAKVHEELLNTSHLFIDETVATLSRMQRITGKVIKKSEPILEKQIEITFDAVEALKDQAGKGGKRALKLLGLTKQYNKISNTIAEKINAMPTASEVIEDAKEFVGKAKSDVEEKIEEIKKIGKIGEIGETGKIVKQTPGKASTVKTAKKVTAKAKAVKTAAKKTAKKVVTNAKVAVAKKVAVVAKPVAKKTAKKVVAKVAKKVETKAKVAVAKKATPISKAKVATAKATVTKSELTQIKGIGESLAGTMADNGIKTITELQNATPTALKVIAAKAGNRYKTFDTNNWITAAKAFAK